MNSDYPTVEEFLDRDPIEMNWREFGHYIRHKTNIGEEEAIAFAASLYGFDNAEIASRLVCSPDMVEDLLRINMGDFDNQTRLETVETPLPSTPMRVVGEIHYVMSEEWPYQSNGGMAEIYCGVNDNIVVVRESHTVTEDENLDTKYDGVREWEERERFVQYDSYNSFVDDSPYAPQHNVGSNIFRYGGLYNESQQ